MTAAPVQSPLVAVPACEPVIRLEAVSVRYRLPRERIRTIKEYAIRRLRGESVADEFWALRDVSLTAERGEMVAIIGANGAGKSTLLKLVARVLRPSAGRVRVEGIVAPLLEVSAGFHPELTGRENVYLNATLLGHGRNEINERFDAIVDFAGLWDFIDAPLRTFSTGMVARLGFAVAMAWQPDILILDEILAVGDEAFRRKCRAHIDAIRECGTTILQVSHDLAQVRAMCDRAVWLDHGEIRDQGTAEVVTANYEEAMQRDAPGVTTIVLSKLDGIGLPGADLSVYDDGADENTTPVELAAWQANGHDYTKHWRSDNLLNVIPNSPRFGRFPEGWNVVDFLRRYAAPLAGDRVIDLGCGIGRLCEAFEASAYLGLDVNEEAIARARAEHAGYRFDAVEYVGDYPAADLYLAYMLLLYVDDAAAAEIVRRLGRVASRVLIVELLGRHWRKHGYHPLFARERAEYEELLAEQGFVLDEQVDKPYAYFPNARISFLLFRRRNPPPAALTRFPDDLADLDLELEGVHDDGWVAADAGVTLSRSREAPTLVVRLIVPDLGDPNFSVRLAVSLDGQMLATETLFPGEFELRCPVHGPDGPRQVGLSFSATQCLPAPDCRHVAGLVRFIGFTGLEAAS